MDGREISVTCPQGKHTTGEELRELVARDIKLPPEYSSVFAIWIVSGSLREYHYCMFLRVFVVLSVMVRSCASLSHVTSSCRQSTRVSLPFGSCRDRCVCAISPSSLCVFCVVCDGEELRKLVARDIKLPPEYSGVFAFWIVSGSLRGYLISIFSVRFFLCCL